MAKASTHLAISHPVVSKTISDLERTLEVRLFDRNAQGVEPTPYGRALLDCAVAVFDEMRQGIKRIEFLADAETGELRIGCPEIMTLGLLPAIAGRFSRDRPGIRLHVLPATSGMLQFHELRERKVEFLLAHLPRLRLDDDLVVESLFDEPFLAVAGVRSRWARRRKIELGDLIDEPWVLPPYDSVPGALIAEIFRAAGLEPPQPGLITMSAQLTAAMIASGRFVGLLPGYVVRFSGGRLGLKVLPAKLASQRIEIGIITVKNRTLSPLAELFIECARDVTQSISDRTGSVR
jgi:DNA-binding transcriptional LysR family regulator